MSEPDAYTTKKIGLWVQPGGYNTQPYFLGCHTVDDLEAPGGGIKDLIRCFKPDGTGWRVRGSTRNPPDPITTKITTIIEATADWLETIIENGNCPFPIYLHAKDCPAYDTFAGASRWWTLDRAEIGTTTLIGMGHREEDNTSEQAFEITAWPPLLRGWSVHTTPVVNAETANLNSITSCGAAKCADSCGPATVPCDTLAAGADATAGAANVQISYDNGVTWAATAADPFAGLITADVKSLWCFPISSTTYRLLAARDQAAATPMHVAYSDDWGANWTDVTVTGSTNAYGCLYSGGMFVLDATHIWLVIHAVAGGTEIWFSANGGETWVLQYRVAVIVLYAVWFSDELHGMAVGTTDDVYTTTDGGMTWAVATATGGGDTNLSVSENAGGGIWWIGTNAGELWYSSDQGVTWANRAFPNDGAGSVYRSRWSSKSVGFMVHSPTNATGRVYRTHDGGFTWELASGTVAGELYDVLPCTTNQAWSVGEIAPTNPLILKIHQ